MAVTLPHPCITATQLVRDYPAARRRSETEPIVITSHGRTEALLISPDTYADLVSQAQADHSRSDSKLALVLEAIDTFVLILDQGLHIRRASRAIIEAFQTAAEVFVGKHVSFLINTQSDRFIIQRLEEVLQSGQPEVFIAPSLRRPDRTVRYAIRPWPGGIALFADDITDHEKVQDSKVAAEAMDHALDAFGGIGSLFVQADGTIISASAALARMVGSSSGRLAGGRLQGLVAPSCRELVDKTLTAESTSARTLQIEYLRNGVAHVPAIMSIAAYWTAEHHTCAAVAIHDPHYCPLTP